MKIQNKLIQLTMEEHQHTDYNNNNNNGYNDGDGGENVEKEYL